MVKQRDVFFKKLETSAFFNLPGLIYKNLKHKTSVSFKLIFITTKTENLVEKGSK